MALGRTPRPAGDITLIEAIVGLTIFWTAVFAAGFLFKTILEVM